MHAQRELNLKDYKLLKEEFYQEDKSEMNKDILYCGSDDEILDGDKIEKLVEEQNSDITSNSDDSTDNLEFENSKDDQVDNEDVEFNVEKYMKSWNDYHTQNPTGEIRRERKFSRSPSPSKSQI